MIRKYIILGFTLMLVGAAAISWIYIDKQKERKQANYCSSKQDSEINEYLQQYKQWLSLPPQERGKPPWILGKNGQIKTNAQLQQEQDEKLKADIEKLAEGRIGTYPYADIIYGENWQDKVNKYRKLKELKETIFTASIACICAGGTIVVCCLLIHPMRWVLKRFPFLRKFRAKIFKNRKEPKDSNPTKLNEETYEEIPHIPLAYLLDPKTSSRSVATELPRTRAIQIENALKNQVEKLEKQVDAIRQMASNSFLQETEKSQSEQNNNPLNSTLTELTQQITAIREYASQQQEKVKKLQDGYDLNIIKNFCTRIIRCIDNIDNCIDSKSEQDIEVMHLKETRDELLFALESSGVEQFVPEVNSDYCGQERLAEAVKEKEHCDDPQLIGKIAKVIKPGYQYFVDENNIKVVRPAMIKLFG
jgi:molecular chaperone GrpE (heat shock protein)